jgi:small-conductance mechanosensitive channel
MVSGALLFTSDLFEIGDLIETNNIQGIVKGVNLNYTIIREFDGVEVIIPNSNVYSSTIVKFTQNKFKILEPFNKEKFQKKKHYKEYIKFVNEILSAEIKNTIYIKNVEILSSINPINLDEILSDVFERYKSIFGMKSDYVVGMTRYGRTRIKFRLKSNKPELILNFTDSFLRDVVFALYPEEIYDGWKSYKKISDKNKNGGN